MNEQPIDIVLSKLDATQAGKNQWNAKCPCRKDDDNPSLRVSVGANDQVMMKCLRGGGCDINQICDSMGITMQDLFPEKKETKKSLDLKDTYKYYDANGELVMEVLRFVDQNGKKTFRQRRPNPDGGWDWSTSGIEKPLYRLPQVIEAISKGTPIYIVEGEKDVHTLESLGKVATTNPGGAGGEGINKWTDAHTESLSGANVIIIADNDEPGMIHAEHVRKCLSSFANKVKLFKPEKFKDVSEIIGAGIPLADGLVEITTTETTKQEVNAKQDALSSLINDLERLHDNPKISNNGIISSVISKLENFIIASGETNVDTGTLVEWNKFLEEDADLSYDWVIPNVLERQERVIVVAAEGAGKTTLARQVALLSAAGIHPFRRDKMKPVRTMMIDLENPERIIRRTSKRIYDKIKWFNQHEEMDAHLLMKPDGVNLLKASDRAMIEEHVAEIKPDILFFGPLYKAFIDPGGRTAESVSIEIAKFLDYIRHNYNCALWIEHHAPLGSGGQRDLRPFGSAVWSRWSEFGIALAPDPTDPELIQFKHYRGQRETREWPELCKRGETWPFEVVEFSHYQPGTEERYSSKRNDNSDEFEDSSYPW